MDFGERIYELRSKNGLTQGELAEKLGVSRQAVSKWENNSAVPDLDKLLKMRELFSVSLDEIVKGKETADVPTENIKRTYEASRTADSENMPEENLKAKFFPARKIFALILFGTAILIAVLSLFFESIDGFILCVPCIIFGLVCYFGKNYTGLNCLWLFYLMFGFFSTYMSGLNFTVYAIRFMFNDIRYLFSGLAALAVNLFLFVFTVKKVKNRPIKNLCCAKAGVIIRWCLLVLFFVISMPISVYLVDSVVIAGQQNDVLSTALQLLSLAENVIPLVLLTLATAYTVRYMKVKNTV